MSNFGARHAVTERWQDRKSSRSDTAPFPPTMRQADLLGFIEDHAAKNDGRALSFDEMAAKIGLKSKAGVSNLIEVLAERGLVRRLSGRARAIAVNAEPATSRNASPWYRA